MQYYRQMLEYSFLFGAGSVLYLFEFAACKVKQENIFDT